MPVSKIPEGLTDVKNEADIARETVKSTGTAQESVDAVMEDLEANDGVKSPGLFSLSSPRSKSTAKMTKAEVEEEEAFAAAEEEEDGSEAALAAKFWSKSHSRLVGSKFVLLSDVLPPLPAKGDFDLERIRESLYFFS